MPDTKMFAQSEYEGTPLYEALKSAVEDLVKNKDLKLTASIGNVAGHLTKKVLSLPEQRHHETRRVM